MVIVEDTDQDPLWESYSNDLMVQIDNMVVGDDGWLNQIMESQVMLVESPVESNLENYGLDQTH